MKLYACYSETAAKFGTILYQTPNGNEIEVTGVMMDDPACEFYCWEDKVLLGEVVDGTARPGRPDTDPITPLMEIVR